MGVLGQDEVNVIKDIGEQEDIAAAIEELSGGHHTSDLSNAINYCKRVFSSCPNTRHQSVIYLTNNRNPFGRDDFWESSYFVSFNNFRKMTHVHSRSAPRPPSLRSSDTDSARLWESSR